MKKMNSMSMWESMGIKSQAKEGLIYYYSKVKVESVLNNLRIAIETSNTKAETITQ